MSRRSPLRRTRGGHRAATVFAMVLALLSIIAHSPPAPAVAAGHPELGIEDERLMLTDTSDVEQVAGASNLHSTESSAGRVQQVPLIRVEA